MGAVIEICPCNIARLSQHRDNILHVSEYTIGEKRIVPTSNIDPENET